MDIIRSVSKTSVNQERGERERKKNNTRLTNQRPEDPTWDRPKNVAGLKK